MRKNFLLLLLSLFSIKTMSQVSEVEKLQDQIAKHPQEDTARVNLFSQLSRNYLFSKPDSAFLFAQQGLELSRKLNYKPGEIACLRATGKVFENTGNYPKALEFYLQEQKLAEELNDEQNIALSLSSLSDVYFYSGDINRSLDYSHKAISLFQKLNNTTRLGIALLNAGDTYEKSNQLDSALAYTRKGYLIAQSVDNESSLAVARSNMGNIFLKLGKTDSAMIYYKSSIPNLNHQNNDEGLSETFIGIARIFFKQNKTDSGLFYARLSFAIAKNAGFTGKVLDASAFLAEYYKSVHNVDSAYAYQSATIAAKDSLFSQQKANQVQGMTFDESMRQQQIEDAKEQAQAQLRQNTLIGVLATVAIAAFLLYRNNRQKQKANKLLQKQKQEIDDKAKELAVQKDNVELLGEIGRKITSSLSVERIISTVYDNVNALMDASVFGIGICNDALKRIEFPATYENGKALPAYSNSIYDENRFAPVCFNSGKEIIIGDLDKEYSNFIQQVQDPHEGDQPISLIFLPLVVKEKKLGVITVQSFQKNAYTDYHLYMLRNIAVYTAIALDNAESYEELSQTIISLKKAQTQLVQSEKMASLGELTAGIAHEIQNPLNFVNNFSEVSAELIDEWKAELAKGNGHEAIAIADDIKQNLEKIIHHGKRADAIVKGMLQHSRQSSAKKEPTDINKLAGEYLHLAYHGFRAKDKNFDTEIKTDFDHTIEKINVVPQDIGRVILNLINNAFYAVNEKLTAHRSLSTVGYKPVVRVQIKKLNDKIEIKVEDNGNGIPQNIIDKIFQPFFTTKPTGQGTGLGLSLAYDIINAHRGEIKVESKEVEGTTFIVQLPAFKSNN